MIGVRDVPAGVEVGEVAHPPLVRVSLFRGIISGFCSVWLRGKEERGGVGFYRRLLPCAELGFCVLVVMGCNCQRREGEAVMREAESLLCWLVLRWRASMGR